MRNVTALLTMNTEAVLEKFKNWVLENLSLSGFGFKEKSNNFPELSLFLLYLKPPSHPPLNL